MIVDGFRVEILQDRTGVGLNERDRTQIWVRMNDPYLPRAAEVVQADHPTLNLGGLSPLDGALYRELVPGEDLSRAVEGMVDRARAFVAAAAAQRATLFDASGAGPIEERRRALSFLLEHYGHTPEATEAARLAALSDDPELRLRGALVENRFELGWASSGPTDPGVSAGSRLLPREGSASLAILRDGIADARIPESLRLEALAKLVRILSPDEVEQILITCLAASVSASPDSEALAERAIAELGRLARASAVPALAATRIGAPPRRLIALARALATLGDPSVEPTLIELLDAEDDGVILAALRALGRVGSAAALPAVVRACARARPYSERAETAEAVIAVLRGRGGREEAGRLSIVDSAATDGQLSFASESGSLSLPDAQGGLSEVPCYPADSKL